MILALDFDDVLHPTVSETEPRFCRLHLIESWLRAWPGIDVVISSSWREVHPFDVLQSFFAEDLRKRVIGTTPLAHTLLGPLWSRSDAERAVAIGERQFEIEQWMASHRSEAEAWMALDDDGSLFRADCNRVVLCDSSIGLTMEQLLRLNKLALMAA